MRSSNEAQEKLRQSLLLRMPSLCYGETIMCTITLLSASAPLLNADNKAKLDTKYPPGTRVECNWYGRGRWFKGVIISRDGAEHAVNYDDGDSEKGVPDSRLRPSTDWECPTCTFVNVVSAGECAMCATGKPNMGDNSKFIADKNAAAAHAKTHRDLALTSASSIAISPLLDTLRVRDQAVVLPDHIRYVRALIKKKLASNATRR